MLIRGATRWAIPALAVAVAVAVALVVAASTVKANPAGLSTKQLPGGAPRGSANPYLAGRAYAACMRAHGVPHPDPDRNGDFHLTPTQEQRLRAAGHARVEAATRACFKYLKPVVSTKPLSAQAKARAKKVLAQVRTCVRRLGFTLGEPVVQNMTLGRAFFGFQPGDPPSKAMNQAERTCERRVQLAKKLDAIIAADRAPV